MRTRIFKSLTITLLALFFAACGEKETKKSGDEETINSGKLTVYVEDGIYSLMDTTFDMYLYDNPDVKLSVEVVNSRKAMATLLSGEARVIIVSRDYLKDEDSLMKAYKVKKHERMPIADDALAFFTQSGFPLDTMNTIKISKLLLNKDMKFSSLYPEAGIEPEFVTTGINSSLYANIEKLALNKKEIKRKLKLFSSADSVVKYVQANPNAIGIAYLSDMYNKQGLKALRLGYIDSAGVYQRATKPVHQGYIVKGEYPYIVTHWAYLRDDRRNLPFWFAMYISRETEAQQHFMKSGIAPRFAKIHLIPEE